MKSYNFRLQRLLGFRNMQEEEAIRELGMRRMALEKETAKLSGLQREEEYLLDWWQKQVEADIELPNLQITQEYSRHLDDLLDRQSEQYRNKKTQVEEQREVAKQCWRKKRMLEILNRIVEGEGKEGDISLLEELGEHIKDTSLCGLGQSAPNPILSTIRYFRPEYETHIKNQKCPAGSCSALASAYIIDQEACVSCGQCARVCPVDAISVKENNQYIIDAESCISCGACENKCPVDAISQG